MSGSGIPDDVMRRAKAAVEKREQERKAQAADAIRAVNALPDDVQRKFAAEIAVTETSNLILIIQNPGQQIDDYLGMLPGVSTKDVEAGNVPDDLARGVALGILGLACHELNRRIPARTPEVLLAEIAESTRNINDKGGLDPLIKTLTESM